MRSQPRAMRASPKVVGFLVLVGSIVLAYEIGQWVLTGGIRGLGLHVGMLVGVAVALAVLVRWRMGILLFLFWLTFEDLIRKYLGGNMFIYFIKDALLAVIYVSFFVGVARGKERLFRPKFWVPLVALFFLALAQVSIHSAVNRTESRGAHAREDFPDRDDAKWMVHTVAWREGDGKVKLGTRPVHMYTLSNEVQVFPPKARVY